MYNNTSYEEYMRTVLGYTPNCMQNMYNTNDYYIMQNNNCMNDCNLQDLYPDIYRKIYPLVCNECNNNQMNITQEVLEQMTDNVYNQIEIDLKINTNVELRKEDTKSQSVRQENRAPRRDGTLRDLIKILLLRELLGGGIFQPRPPFPTRPPFPGPGSRLPFQGGPIRPREI